ncbi:Mitogen-activated protein kinase-binding protein 1 [Holothuria leucospilota]|uniref:Mitogen-activated protein kinase-binding protein 1 n=1 Tax=Holothuria leucospilota TaxID=206669 RepID=A0A9Q1CGK4_HOLLE|nr:Mitogen-activated protein kinase-binding protein 1 [Holothuria leucospilota]
MLRDVLTHKAKTTKTVNGLIISRSEKPTPSPRTLQCSRMGRKSKVTLSHKRKSRVTHLGGKVTLERVLGLTSQSDSSLACCPCTGHVAYAAGCVIVVFNPRKNRQEYIFSVSRKTVTALAFSPDGKHLVSGECGHNPAVRVWDLEDKSEVRNFSGHKFGISCVAFSPGGGYIVSVGEEHDMVINVWDWKGDTGKVSSGKIATMVTDIAFSEDGNTFVTVGNRSVKFWYFSGKSKTRQILPLNGRNSILGEQKNNLFCSVTFGRGNNSSRVYAVTKSGLLCEFNEDRMLDKWVELRTRQAFSISASDHHLFVGCADGVMRIFSASTLHFITSLPKPHHQGIDVAAGIDKDHIFSPKENVKFPDTVAAVMDNLNMKVICIYSDHSLYVWDVHDVHKIGKQWSFLNHSSCIWGVDIYPQVPEGNKVTLPPNTFVTCGSDDTVRFWNIDPMMDSNIFSKNIYSPELLKVLYMEEDEDLSDDNTDSKEGVRSVCFSPDGQMLASGDRSGNIRVNDLLQANMSEIHKIAAHDAEVLCLEFSQADTGYNLLASASRDRFIHIFDMNNNCSLLQTVDDHSSSITSVKFSQSNGRFQMISCGADKALLFRTATYNPDLQFALHHHVGSKTTLYDMAIDVSKKYVATACQDRNLRIHNISSGKLKQTYKGSQSEDGTLIKVELDPSGMYAATSCSDKTLAIFDFYSGACMATMMGHSELVTGIKFTNDCRQLISVSGDGCIFVWKLPFEMTNNMKERINERKQRLKVAAQLNQARRETFIIPSSPPQIIPPQEEPDIVLTERQDLPDMPDDEMPPEYRFSMGQLPLWAQKKVTGEDLPSPDKYSNPAQPRGKWAQKLGSEGFSLMSKDTAIPVRLQDFMDRRRFTLEPETMNLWTQQSYMLSQDEDEDDDDDDDDEFDDDEFDFAPAEERLNELEEQMGSTESPPTSPGGSEKIRRTRGSDAMSKSQSSSPTRGEEITQDESEEGTEEDVSVAEDEQKLEEDDEDVSEVIIYPPEVEDTSPTESLDFHVTEATLSVEELARKKHRRANSRELMVETEIGDKEKEENQEGEESADVSEDDDDTTPDITPISSPKRKKVASLSSPEDEEKFLHANFTFAEKEKFNQCLEQIKDIKRDEKEAERRQSLSAKFLKRSQSETPIKAVNTHQVLEQFQRKRKEETKKAVEAMRNRLQSYQMKSIPETKTPPTTPSGDQKPFQSSSSNNVNIPSSTTQTKSSDPQSGDLSASSIETHASSIPTTKGSFPDKVDSTSNVEKCEKDANSLSEIKSVGKADLPVDNGSHLEDKEKSGENQIFISTVTRTEQVIVTLTSLGEQSQELIERPKDLKLPQIDDSKSVQTCKESQNPQQQKEKREINGISEKKTEVKATEMLLTKTKKDTGKDTKGSKDDLFHPSSKETEQTKSKASMKRSSSLSKLHVTGSESDSVQPRSRIRSQSSERQSNAPNASARQKHRSRSDRVNSPVIKSYEASTESALAKIKKRVVDSPLQKIRGKRSSLPSSGPIKATEDAIKPSSSESRMKAKEESKVVDEMQKKKDSEMLVKQEVEAEKPKEKREVERPKEPKQISTGSEKPSNANGASSLINILEESVCQLNETFERSLALLTELHQSGQYSHFMKGLETLSECYLSMGESFNGLKRMQASLPLDGATREIQHQHFKSSLSTLLHPTGTNGTNGTTRAGDETATAALKLLDQYSNLLVSMVQTKLNADIPEEDEEKDKEIYTCPS